MLRYEYDTTRSDGKKLYRAYSDQGMKIRKDGTEEVYNEAVDVEDSGFTYTETDIPIEGDTGDEQAQKAAAFDYLTGRGGSDE